MNSSRAYAACGVKQVKAESIWANRQGQSAELGLDVGKQQILAVLRYRDGGCLRPWRISNPLEIGALVSLLRQVADHLQLTVAMESTGTYGDPLRQALCDAQLKVQRVSSKASHDWAEAYDGVPSQHDGKDAAVIAELCAMGKARPWAYQPADESDQQLGYWVDRWDLQLRLGQIWHGRLESRLARHWPELGRWLKLSSATLLRALQTWACPAAMAADRQASAQLKGWGRRPLSPQTVAGLLEDSRCSAGVRMSAWDQRRMREDASQLLEIRRRRRIAGRELAQLAAQHPVIAAMAQVVGPATACVLWVAAGDPRGYFCAAAYRKALGLNLAERSSGQFKGQLHISKRGWSMARRALYFAALRYVRQPPVRAWYIQKVQRDGGKKLAALVAVMRKLPLATHAVAQGQAFDPARLFNRIGQQQRPLAARR